MHRRSYLPDSHNRRNLITRHQVRAERNAALRKAEALERELEGVKASKPAPVETIREKVSTFLQKTKRFFTKPIKFKGAA